LITNDGKLWIRRYLAGQVAGIARSIAVGISTKPGVTTDQRLQFEVGRVDVSVTSLDAVNGNIIFKAQLPNELDGVINEIGIFSSPASASNGQYASALLTTFDSETETWRDPGTSVPAVYSTAAARIGGDSVRHSPAASSSESDILNELSFDLVGYSGNDLFAFAYNVGNENTADIQFRFMTDNANYYFVSFGAQTSGYKFVEVPKSSLLAAGSPDWSRITSIQVTTVSGAGGASQVDFDGIRIQDIDTFNPEVAMVARIVLSTPFVKHAGKIQEVEFSLGVNV